MRYEKSEGNKVLCSGWEEAQNTAHKESHRLASVNGEAGTILRSLEVLARSLKRSEDVIFRFSLESEEGLKENFEEVSLKPIITALKKAQEKEKENNSVICEIDLGY